MRYGFTTTLASTVMAAAGGGAPEISFALPGSDAYPLDLFHMRRALIGGTLSRAWISFDQGGTTYVFSFQHNGSRADPTVHVGSLSGATHAYVDLGSSNNTPAQVRTALLSAMTTAGISGASADGTDAEGRAVVTITGASNLTVPPAVDMTDELLRGMWGAQRDDWGGATNNLNGGTTGTGSIHLGNPNDQAGVSGRTGRVLGVYLWGHGGHQPRLAASTGPAYTTSPASFSILGEAVCSDALAAGLDGISAGVFDAVEFSSSDVLWAHYREDAAGGPRYRSHGATPEGNGDLGVSQLLVWDTTSSTSSASALGPTYVPTVDNTFSIYIMIGVIFELQDASGNYPANGAIRVMYGDHNDDPNHGTQFIADQDQLGGEVTSHRFLFPEWTDVEVTEIQRVVEDIGIGEDSRVALYLFTDLDFPSTTPATLVADMGLMGIDTPNAYNSYVLSTPVPVGTGDIGTGTRYLAITFNYVPDAPLVTYDLPVFLDAADNWLNAWVDARAEWHDDIEGASGSRAQPSGVSEYRSRNVAGMPIVNTTDTYPDPWVTDATDDSPAAIALDRVYVDRAGIVAVA